MPSTICSAQTTSSPSTRTRSISRQLASARAEPELHELARRLATESPDRGPVKFGIAMLGSMGDERDLDIVRTLALHDEFGLYAAEAIAEIAPDRQQALHRHGAASVGAGDASKRSR